MLLALAAPLLALVAAASSLTAVVLAATGKKPFEPPSASCSTTAQVGQPGLHHQQGDDVLPGGVSRWPSASG